MLLYTISNELLYIVINAFMFKNFFMMVYNNSSYYYTKLDIKNKLTIL